MHVHCSNFPLTIQGISVGSDPLDQVRRQVFRAYAQEGTTEGY